MAVNKTIMKRTILLISLCFTSYVYADVVCQGKVTAIYKWDHKEIGVRDQLTLIYEI